MVLRCRRSRTVLGRLVARHYPVGPAGLGAGWLPGASWGGGFPGCGTGCRRLPGPRRGWPCRVLWGGTVPVRAAPGPVAEPASPEHQRCRVVPGRLRVVLAQRGEPVLRPPPRAVSRINDHDGKSRVGGHLHQPLAQLPGRDARYQAAEPRPRFPRDGRLPCRSRPSLLASVKSRSSITIARAPCSPGGGDDGADRGAQPPVAGGGGPPGQVQRHRERDAEHVPVRRDDGDPQVPGVQVDGHHRVRPGVPSSGGTGPGERSSMTRRGTTAPMPGPA